MTENERKQYLTEFGERVRFYREKAKMTQRELGKSNTDRLTSLKPKSQISRRLWASNPIN